MDSVRSSRPIQIVCTLLPFIPSGLLCLGRWNVSRFLHTWAARFETGWLLRRILCCALNIIPLERRGYFIFGTLKYLFKISYLFNHKISFHPVFWRSHISIINATAYSISHPIKLICSNQILWYTSQLDNWINFKFFGFQMNRKRDTYLEQVFSLKRVLQQNYWIKEVKASSTQKTIVFRFQ